jgi:hypothetical protein
MRTGKGGKFLDDSRSTKTFFRVATLHNSVASSPGNTVYFPDSTYTSSYSSSPFRNPYVLQENSSLRKDTAYSKPHDNSKAISCKHYSSVLITPNMQTSFLPGVHWSQQTKPSPIRISEETEYKEPLYKTIKWQTL